MATCPVLPDEIVSFILNGVDERGRPLLDRRHRFMARQACHAWYRCAFHPSSVDAARINLSAPRDADGEAWTRGRLACISLVVEGVVAGMAPGAAVTPWKGLIVEGVDRAAASAFVAAGNSNAVVDEFGGIAHRLAAAIGDGFRPWFKSSHLFYMPRDDHVDTRAQDKGANTRASVRSALLRVACRVGRFDVVDGLLDRYNLMHEDTLGPCIADAAARDHADTVDVLLQRMARVYGHDRRHAMRECVMDHALAVAIQTGSVGVWARVLVGWGRDKAPPCVQWDTDAQGSIHDHAKPMHKNWQEMAVAYGALCILEHGARIGLSLDPITMATAAVAYGRTMDVLPWLWANDLKAALSPDAALTIIGNAVSYIKWIRDYPDAGDALWTGVDWIVRASSLVPSPAQVANMMYTRAASACASLSVVLYMVERWPVGLLSQASTRYSIEKHVCTLAAQNDWATAERIMHALDRDGGTAGEDWRAPFDVWACVARDIRITYYRECGTLCTLSDYDIGCVRALGHLARVVGMLAHVDDARLSGCGLAGVSVADSAMWRRWCAPRALPIKREVDATAYKPVNQRCCEARSILRLFDEVGLALHQGR